MNIKTGAHVHLITKSGMEYTGIVSRQDDITITISVDGEATDATILVDRVESIKDLTTAAGSSTYTATYNGITAQRKSRKAYTYASVVQWGDGTVDIISFHMTHGAAMKGTLTAQQKQHGASVIAVVPVTKS